MAITAERKLRVVADNRKARFNYFIDDTMEAGFAIVGDDPQFPLSCGRHAAVLASPRFQRVADFGQQLQLLGRPGGRRCFRLLQPIDALDGYEQGDSDDDEVDDH